MMVKDDLEKTAKNALKTQILHTLEIMMKSTSVIDQLYVNVAD